MGVRVTAEGFAFFDAKALDTEDETAHCNACDRTFPLAEIML